MKKTLFTLAFLVSGLISFAEVDNTVSDSKTTTIEKPKFLKNKIVIKYLIEKDGEVKVKRVKWIGHKSGKEAKRMIANLPKNMPNKNRKRAVKVRVVKRLK